MAYEGAYPPRPFNGQQRPPPQRQYPGGPAPQAYSNYQDQGDYGYDGGYDGYGGGYDQGFDGYGQRPPPQRDPYGPGRNGPMRGGPMNGGRGGQNLRAPMNDGYYGGPGRLNGAPGRGRPPPVGAPNSDPTMNRPRQPLLQSQKSPGEPGFGDSPFPAFPGQHRKTNLDEEQQILSKMGSLDIDAKRKGPPRGRGPTRGPSADDYGPSPSMDSQRGPPGPPRNYPPQGYPDQRGTPPGRGYGDYREPGFGPPQRTNTMPMNSGPPDMTYTPQRSDSAPYNGPIARGMQPPARPATSQGHRQPPQGPYAPNQMQSPPQGGYAGYDEYGGGYYDDPGYYGEYYPGNDYGGNNGYPPQNQPQEPDMPDFDAVPRGRNSLDISLNPGDSVPELSKTKSQPDLRQPQQAVFEMAPNAPPMPTMSPSPVVGLPSDPRAGRLSNPDSLPSHPAPVRAGHMPGSMVNNKPPPVRNYGGSGTPVPVPMAMSTPSPAPAPMQAPMNGGPLPQAPGKEAQQLPVTPEELESLRNMVKVNPGDQVTALRLAKRLIQAVEELAEKVPDARSRNKDKMRYLSDARKILEKLSKAGNSDAMFTLADGLGRGLFRENGEPDNKEAFTMYQSAAKIGHAAAAYRTAVCCEIGNEEGGGTRKDPLKAIQWYKRAAMLGDTPAMYKVGMILLKGLLGQQRNPREAISWLKRAADAADEENPHALHELGLLYESAGPNDVILRDETYAFQLFRRAAELGYKFSQFRMGCVFEYGLLGCLVDPRMSIMWYSKAAEQGEHQAELALSGWYLTGSDNVLGQNDMEAYLWARKAAQAGLAKAEYAMGYFTEMGIGTASNMDDAKRWYWRAAAQDFPKARERLEELKRSGKNGPRQRERITRSKIGQQNEGECSVM